MIFVALYATVVLVVAVVMGVREARDFDYDWFEGLATFLVVLLVGVLVALILGGLAALWFAALT